MFPLRAQHVWRFIRPRGPLVFEVGYHPRKKIHVIRVVFQDKAMYARTSFRGAKTCKIGKKGCVFGHIDKFWKGHDGQIKKNTCKNTYLGSIFIHEKYVFGVCFECPFTRMISSLKYKCPPPGYKTNGAPERSYNLGRNIITLNKPVSKDVAHTCAFRKQLLSISSH